MKFSKVKDPRVCIEIFGDFEPLDMKTSKTEDPKVQFLHKGSIIFTTRGLLELD